MAQRTVTLNQIEYFLAVAEHLSFTKAAEALYKSQPAVTKQISALEKQVGVPLFYRTKRFVALTAAGTELYGRLTRISKEIEDAVDASAQVGKERTEVINIGVLTGIGADDIIMPFLTQFTKSCGQNIQVNFETHSFKTLREMLLKGVFDAILTLTFELDRGDAFRSLTLKKMGAILIMSKDDPFAGRRKLPAAAELAGREYAAISQKESQGAYEQTMCTFSALGFAPKAVRTYPNLESVLYAVGKNKLLAFVDDSVTYSEMNKLKSLPVPVCSVELAFVCRQENESPVLNLFAEKLADHVEVHDLSNNQ